MTFKVCGDFVSLSILMFNGSTAAIEGPLRQMLQRSFQPNLLFSLVGVWLCSKEFQQKRFGQLENVSAFFCFVWKYLRFLALSLVIHHRLQIQEILRIAAAAAKSIETKVSSASVSPVPSSALNRAPSFSSTSTAASPAAQSFPVNPISFCRSAAGKYRLTAAIF